MPTTLPTTGTGPRAGRPSTASQPGRVRICRDGCTAALRHSPGGALQGCLDLGAPLSVPQPPALYDQAQALHQAIITMAMHAAALMIVLDCCRSPADDLLSVHATCASANGRGMIGYHPVSNSHERHLRFLGTRHNARPSPELPLCRHGTFEWRGRGEGCCCTRCGGCLGVRPRTSCDAPRCRAGPPWGRTRAPPRPLPRLERPGPRPMKPLQLRPLPHAAPPCPMQPALLPKIAPCAYRLRHAP